MALIQKCSRLLPPCNTNIWHYRIIPCTKEIFYIIWSSPCTKEIYVVTDQFKNKNVLYHCRHGHRQFVQEKDFTLLSTCTKEMFYIIIPLQKHTQLIYIIIPVRKKKFILLSTVQKNKHFTLLSLYKRNVLHCYLHTKEMFYIIVPRFVFNIIIPVQNKYFTLLSSVENECF